MSITINRKYSKRKVQSYDVEDNKILLLRRQNFNAASWVSVILLSSSTLFLYFVVSYFPFFILFYSKISNLCFIFFYRIISFGCTYYPRCRPHRRHRRRRSKLVKIFLFIVVFLFFFLNENNVLYCNKIWSDTI